MPLEEAHTFLLARWRLRWIYIYLHDNIAVREVCADGKAEMRDCVGFVYAPGVAIQLRWIQLSMSQQDDLR